MIIVITGPTGVGKTKLSIALAKKYNAEIINGDSVQIYEGLDIGSAKVTKEEMESIPHHLFSIRKVTEDYSIYEYQKDCRKLIEDIERRGKNVIIVGGTGLYIKSALYDYTLSEENHISELYEDKTTEELANRLVSLDKDIKIDLKNRRRVIRALNYYLENGKSITTNKQGSTLLYNTIFIGLTMENRALLYERLNSRVDKMFELGLLEEVKEYYQQGIKTKPLLSAIGYKELYRYFDHEITLDEAKELIKKNTRHYAKRQYTFFNNQFSIHWFNVNIHAFDSTIDEVINYINDKR